MADKNSLIIDSTVGTVKSSKSITDINPNATDAELSAFATALYGLTTNNVSAVTKVNKRDIIADNIYPVTVSGSVEGNAFTKVDDTHCICDITKLKAASDWATEFFSLTFTANNQAVNAAYMAGISIDFSENESPEAGMPFVNVSSVDIGSQDEHWEISLLAPAPATLYNGSIVKITFNQTSYNDFNVGSVTITVTCESGV